MKNVIAIIVVLAATCSAAAAENTPAKLSPTQEGWLKRATIEHKDGWTFLHIEGEPRERGFQHGYLLAPQIVKTMRGLKMEWEQGSGLDWSFLVEKAKTLLTPAIDAENLAELDGIAEGCRAAGVQMSRDEIVACNGSCELGGYWWPKEKDKLNADSPNQYQGHCNAFIATGHMTTDGRIVMAHNTVFSYADAICYLVLDIQPTHGHRILMQSIPGYIHSATDFFVTDAGLMGTETTIEGFKGFDVKGIPEFVRMRRATQDASSIDQWSAIMKKGNNGGLANSWLLGDINTGEIAQLELGLKHVGFERTKDGWFAGSNLAKNLKLLRFETNIQETDGRLSCVARNVRLKALMKEHAGKIDVARAKAIIADHYDSWMGKENPSGRTICCHFDLDRDACAPEIPYWHIGSVDGKVMDAKMAAEMSFAGRWGPPCGAPFDAEKYLKLHPQFEAVRPLLVSRPSWPWTEFHIQRAAGKEAAKR